MKKITTFGNAVTKTKNWFAAFITVLFVSVNSYAQTNPLAQAPTITQNFGTTTFSTLAANFAAWTVNSSPIGSQGNAESSTTSGNATISAASGTQTTGGCYGYAVSSNGRFYIQTSSNGTNGTNQLAGAINATGLGSIVIAYDIEMISANPRTIGVELQYRIGTSGAWTNVSGTVYSHTSTDRSNGNVDSYNVTLPAGADNNAVVQIRWATWRGSQTGNSSGIAIDNISIMASTFQSTYYFRSKQNGNWNSITTWEVSPDNSTWSNAATTPNYGANTITVSVADSVSITATDTIDQVVVNGILSYEDVVGSTPALYNGTGTELTINGKFYDAGPNSITWLSGATWSLGSGGYIIRNRGTSSNNWRDNYAGGISTIPASSHWIARKNSSDNPTLTTIGGMYYPNLTIENYTGSSWVTSTTSSFTGSTSAPVIKGSLDIGGFGTNTVSFLNSSTATAAVYILDELLVRTGNTLRNQGTGFQVEGDLTINGTVDYGTTNAAFILSGNQNQTLLGNLNFKNLELYKAYTNYTATLQSPATIANKCTFTKGYLITTSTYLLTFSDTSTASGVSDSSFVKGPVKKIGNTAFTFPTGKNTNYQPISISAPSNSAAAYTAEYFYQNAALGASKEATIDSVSDCEYWTLNNVGTVYPVSVTVGWNSQSCYTAGSSISKRLTEWDGTKWIDLGNSANAPYTVTSDTLISSFGTFTLAKDICDIATSTNFAINVDGVAQAEMQTQQSKLFHFVAQYTDMDITILNYLNGYNDKIDSIILWSSSCSSLTKLKSDTATSINDSVFNISTTSLTIGDSYYLEVRKGNATDTILYGTSLQMPQSACPTCNAAAIVDQCNLVCNSNFEYKTGVGQPQGTGGAFLVGGLPYEPIQYICSWENGSSSSSDYFNAASTGTSAGTCSVPLNSAGTQTSHNSAPSNAYAGFYAWSVGGPITGPNYHEYITQKLRFPLVAGVTYKASMWVSLAEASNYATNNLGMYFSAAPTNFTGYGLLAVTPQISSSCNYPGTWITDRSNTWVKIEGTITGAGQQYLTIGGFNNANTFTGNFGTGNHWAGAYYYLDEVSVEPIPYTISATPNPSCLGGTVALSTNATTAILCPNGLPINPSVTWSSVPSSTFSPTFGVSTTATPSTVGTTIFTATANYHTGCVIAQTANVTVSSSSLTISVNSRTICLGETASLAASGGTTYTWSSGATSTGVNTANASPLTTTSYTVTGTTGGCSATAVSTVTVIPGASWPKAPPGTSGDGVASSIARDNIGNTYIAGYYSGTTTFGCCTPLTSVGNNTIYVAKYNDCNDLLWVQEAVNSASSWGEAMGVAVDNSGNVYITGDFQGTVDFGGGNSLTATSYYYTTGLVTFVRDIFIAKYDAGGNILQAVVAGGQTDDFSRGITVDNSGNLYITGTSGSDTNPADFGGQSFTGYEWGEFFLAKYSSSNLSTGIWVKDAGGATDSHGSAITLDNSGNIYVTGVFSGTASYGGGLSLTSFGFKDMFLAKYNSSGTAQWAKKGGGTSDDYGEDVYADANGNIYVTGKFASSTASINGQSISIIDPTNHDSEHFVAVCNATNGNVSWAKVSGGTSAIFMGGAPIPPQTNVIADGNGNVYVGATFSTSADFGSLGTLTSAGSHELYIVKYDNTGSEEWVMQTGNGIFSSVHTPANAALTGIAMDAGTGLFYTSGFYMGTVVFGSTSVTASSGTYNSNIFAARLEDYVTYGNFRKFTKPAEASSELNKDVSIYPNPTTGNVLLQNLQNETAQIEVTDMLGKVIIQQLILESGESFSFDLSDQARGLYFVKIKINSTLQVRKINKQ